jgi:hypothetical protein
MVTINELPDINYAIESMQLVGVFRLVLV